jgi:hypothetical protein
MFLYVLVYKQFPSLGMLKALLFGLGGGMILVTTMSRFIGSNLHLSSNE